MKILYRVIIILGLVMIFASCELFGFGSLPPLENFEPLNQDGIMFENLVSLYCYRHDSMELYDPVAKSIVAEYSFSPDAYMQNTVIDSQGKGFYASVVYDRSHLRLVYVDYESGEVIKLEGFEYQSSFLGYNLTTETVYIAGQNEYQGQFYARSVSMPGTNWGEAFRIPTDWLNKNKIISDNDEPVLTMEIYGGLNKLYFSKQETGINIVRDYFHSSATSSALFLLGDDLLNVNYFEEGQGEKNCFKLFRINNLSSDIELLDLSLIYRMDDPFNFLSESEDFFIVFSNSFDNIRIRKISKDGILMLDSIALDSSQYSLESGSVQEWQSKYYLIALDKSHIVEIDQNLGINRIEL